MSKFFEFFNQGWVGSLIGVIGIILGIVGIFSYRISKSAPKPSYQRSSLRLIGREEDNLPNDVAVTYKGNVVERLTKTTLILWNNGTETLDGSNVVEKDPLSISFESEDKILSYKVLKETKDTNAFSVHELPGCQNKLLFTFEYLDPDDGVVIELLHDSAQKYPKISGTIKGLPEGFIDQGRVLEQKNINLKGPLKIILDRPKLIFGAAIAVGLGMVIFGILPNEVRGYIAELLSESSTQKTIDQQPLFFVVFGLFYAAPSAFLLWSRRKKYPKQLEISEIEP
ncbi:hypothetical protein [Aeromonas veronii]|uniref:hypothetical protein n=1 Tax=Aeromonas veronii TaxID=654 RepID=UPI003BA0FA94